MPRGVRNRGWSAFALALAIAGCSGRVVRGNGGTQSDGGASFGGVDSGAGGGSSGFGAPTFAGHGGAPPGDGDDGSSGGQSSGAVAGEGGSADAAGTGGQDESLGGTAGSAGKDESIAGCLGRDFDIRATRVSGKVTVNGVAISDPKTQGVGNVFLLRGSDLALLTDTSSSSYSALIFPGTYDLLYSRYAAGSAVPINASTKLKSEIVVGSEPLTLDIDIPAIRISGALTVNGAAIEDVASTGPGAITLLTPDEGSTTDLATTAVSSYSALVLPATYELRYSYPDGSSQPLATGTRFRTGFEVSSNSGVMDIDVPLTPVSVTVTMNGLPRTKASDAGVLFLVDARNGDARLTASSTLGPFSGQVVPGTYDIYWRAPDKGLLDEGIPRNGAARVGRGIVVENSPLALNLDIPVTTVSGAITINGVPTQTLGSNLGWLKLQGETGTDPSFLVEAGSYSLSLASGTYDLIYVQGATNENSPVNAYTALRRGIIISSASQSLDIDIPTTVVSGTVSFNGKAISELKSPDFSLSLRGPSGGEARLVRFPTFPSKNTYSAVVLPGTYDLYYDDIYGNGLEVPSNASAKIRSGVVVGSTPLTLDVDVRAALLTGTMTVNGATLTDSSKSGGDLLLRTDDTNQVIVRSRGSVYSGLVLPGTYEVRYSGDDRDPALPRNGNAYLGCVRVP